MFTSVLMDAVITPGRNNKVCSSGNVLKVVIVFRANWISLSLHSFGLGVAPREKVEHHQRAMAPALSERSTA